MISNHHIRAATMTRAAIFDRYNVPIGNPTAILSVPECSPRDAYTALACDLYLVVDKDLGSGRPSDLRCALRTLSTIKYYQGRANGFPADINDAVSALEYAIVDRLAPL